MTTLTSDLSSRHVVLVDENNKILGTLDKTIAHNRETPLHRGFSIFIFNNKSILLQKRSSRKKTWANFWSNSCCGHPQINESDHDAIIRHAKYELNICNLDNIQFLSSYKYKFMHDNIVENEICPIYTAHVSSQDITPNYNEVSEIQWLDWHIFLAKISKEANLFTPWSIEEATLVNKLIFHK